MVFFSPAKINLGLRVVGERPDGYHDIETLFYAVPSFADALEFLPNENGPVSSVHSNQGGLTLVNYGLPIDCLPDKNLCVKAFNLLSRDFELPATKLIIYKHIPMGAGLGGGSSNAAYTLIALNQMYSLGLSAQTLVGYAVQLGMDVPFFILNYYNGLPMLGYERGERLVPFTGLDLNQYRIEIVRPYNVHVSTPWAYSQIDTCPEASGEVERLVCRPVEEWRDSLMNDFERPVLNAYPHLSEVKADLYSRGAVYAAMSGSGSAFFAIMPKD